MLLAAVFLEKSAGLLVGGAVLVIIVLAFFCFVFHFSIGFGRKIIRIVFYCREFMLSNFGNALFIEESMKVYTALKIMILTDAGNETFG